MITTYLPRRVYFGAEDRPAASMPGTTREAKEGNHAIETGTRHKLADRLIKSAESVAAGVRIVRALDSTGHTRESLPHLATVVADMNLAYEAFLASVKASFDRHDLRAGNIPATEALAVERRLFPFDMQAAAAAIDASAALAPKPAPRKLKDVPQA